MGENAFNRRLSRRSLLSMGAAGVGLAAATALSGCVPSTPASPTTTPSPTPSGPPPWSKLAASIHGRLLLPSAAGYAQAKLTENPIYDGGSPLAVLQAASPNDVAAALRFAREHAVDLVVRSGGHSYTGASSGGAPGSNEQPSLVLDLGALNDIAMSGTSVVVGAGASLIQLYSVVGAAGRAVAAGSCPTVGVGGLTLGGGVGVLTRQFGLTCDQLTEVQIVTPDGKARTANAQQNADLFWACRGGGGGSIGVVTSFTFATQPAPAMTLFYLSWPFSAAAAVISAWGPWMSAASDQLWSTLKLLGGATHAGGTSIQLSGTWTGDPSALQAQLNALISKSAAANVSSLTPHTYEQAMLLYAGCSNTPVAQCTTAPGGALTRGAYANTSSIAYDWLSNAGVSTLISQAQQSQQVEGLTESGISMDALGGQVAHVAPGASAFVHRNAIATVQYTTTFANSADPSPFFAWARGARNAMAPYWGTHAYVNYADTAITDPGAAYFGANAARLADIAKTYDPDRVFSQPFLY